MNSPASHSRDVNNFYYTNRLDEYKRPNIKIGDYTYGRPTVRFLEPTVTLTIGKFCSIAPGVTILMGGEHRTDWVSTYPFSALQSDWESNQRKLPISKGNVVIGNDVWIGLNATILSGVTIGDGAVIAAHSVIAKNVEPYAIAGGNPAKEIRKRFDDDVIASLLKVRWWDWEPAKIREYVPLISSENIRPFLDAAMLMTTE